MNIGIIKLIKLNVLFTYVFWRTYIKECGLKFSFRNMFPFFMQNLMFINKHRDVFVNDKHGTAVEFCVGVKTCNTITEFIRTLAVIVWLCEKMEITNAKFKFFDKDIDDLFESTSVAAKHQLPTVKKVSWSLHVHMIGDIYIPSEIGYIIFSKVPVRKELKEEADDWLNRHAEGDWVAVHYRGTDVKKDVFRHRIDPDSYIIYLKEVLDSQCRIFVCSDQAQFIDMMRVAFPGRIFSRDIQRSDSDDALHLHPRYRGRQQKRDAMIDMLVLAKADLIYTTGSSFITVIRFFNPKIKIVSLGGPYRHHHIPIPRADLYDSLRIKR